MISKRSPTEPLLLVLVSLSTVKTRKKIKTIPNDDSIFS